MSDAPITGIGYLAYKATSKTVEATCRACGADDQTARETGTIVGIGAGLPLAASTGNPVDVAAIAVDAYVEHERFQETKKA